MISRSGARPSRTWRGSPPATSTSPASRRWRWHRWPRSSGRSGRPIPAISVRLSDPGDTEELVEFVRSGRSEIGLVEPVEDPDLTTVPLARQEFLAVLPPGSEAEPRRSASATWPGSPSWPRPAARRPADLLDDALRPGRPAGDGRRRGGPARGAAAADRGGGRGRPAPPAARRGGPGARLRGARAARRGSGAAVVLVHRDGPLTPAAERFVELARRGTD